MLCEWKLIYCNTRYKLSWLEQEVKTADPNVPWEQKLMWWHENLRERHQREFIVDRNTSWQECACVSCHARRNREQSEQVNQFASYNKSTLSFIAENSTLVDSLRCIVILIIKCKQANLWVESKERSKCSPEPQKASRDHISHPIISKWVRTYVAHARRSPQAQSLLLMVKAPGSSSMAQGCIFLAWFRFTAPLSAKHRCQHRAILSKHVQPMVKQYVQCMQWYFLEWYSQYETVYHGLLMPKTPTYWCLKYFGNQINRH